MYFPIFRGRQFELLALKEMVEKNLLSENIMPVIEPVKASFRLVRVLEAFVAKNHKIAIIRNPQVGFWLEELDYESNKSVKQSILTLLESKCVESAYYVNRSMKKILTGESGILIFDKEESIPYYDQISGGFVPSYNLIPDKSIFRRKIRKNRILCEDHFRKQNKNADYKGIDEEFFSADHLFYGDDGYEGFADYSVIGAEYSESGFAPYAVAIHVVYLKDSGELYICHFVSDSNDDYNDPAGKFHEALTQLIRWDDEHKINTVGMQFFRNCFEDEEYPGLGVIKKYSIMHHLELIGRFLDGKNDNL